MYFGELFSLLGLAVVIGFWLDSMRAREAANAAGKAACTREGFLFLDDTVALEKTNLVRDRQRGFVLRRTYRFEFSDSGDNRKQGSVVMLGRRVELTRLEGLWEPRIVQ